MNSEFKKYLIQKNVRAFAFYRNQNSSYENFAGMRLLIDRYKSLVIYVEIISPSVQ